MGIKVKIIEKSKPGHPEEKLYYVVPDNTGYTYFPVFAYKVSEFTGVYKKTVSCVLFRIKSEGEFKSPPDYFFSVRKIHS
ncbi:MAG: hypothetical protein WC142_08065 [Bacteroidales bacterium]|jgi:hypothetical protein|nr:hypothetical protein [Bacteroidales bacterium]MDD3330420.1 hypothetical protein [Bacteroidales bacterium]MDD3691981.1 hypothetical protein [Bacteroidales bacterium]MDD4044843.1 hypothetical protein [Bacteroidales bacterium]